MFRVRGQVLGKAEAEREERVRAGVLELSRKESTRKVTRERMFLAKALAQVKVSRSERLCVFRRWMRSKKLGSRICQGP